MQPYLNMQKVLMVLEATFPVSGGGGAESQVLTLGKCLLARGIGVQVVVPMVANGPQIKREIVETLDVVRIAYPKFRLVGGFVMLAKLAWLLFVERKNYTFIHAHIANNMAAVCALMGKLLDRPVLVKLTGMKEMVGGILDDAPDTTVRLKKWAIGKADLLQATSVRIQRMLVAAGFSADRIRLLPNGVNVSRFAIPKNHALRQELCGEATLVGIFVGRLAPEKGHESLLRAWATALADHASAKIVLVGDGSEHKKLSQLAHDLGIARQVVFAGHASDVSKFLAIADFGLITSLSEGLSNALLEYMAAGLPVVGSRVSGTEDFVINGETGWLFEPGDEQGLTACLRRVASQDQFGISKMGQAAQRKIIECASLAVVTHELIGFYQVKKV